MQYIIFQLIAFTNIAIPKFRDCVLCVKMNFLDTLFGTTNYETKLNIHMIKKTFLIYFSAL